MNNCLILAAIAVLLATPAAAKTPVSTFSVVGCDPQTGELGVAVASKYFAVGSVVPWAKAGVGAIATQAWVNYGYGIVGLELLEKGLSPQAVIDSLTKADAAASRRQIGVVDSAGNAVTYTGKDCLAWAGGFIGKNCAVQGNILVSEKVAQKMLTAFETSAGSLGDRLLASLLAGDSAGGDSRGRQSAALIVVRPQAGYRYDRTIDIRVDDHPKPFAELRRLYGLAKALGCLNLASQLYQNGNLSEALAQAKLAVETGPTVPETYYDYACYLALSGDTAEALENIVRALQLAPHFKEMAKQDSDLKSLWETERFKEAVR